MKKSFVIVARGNVLAAAASTEHDPGTYHSVQCVDRMPVTEASRPSCKWHDPYSEFCYQTLYFAV